MWIDIALGACVGVVIGATGIGGGAIMTPILLTGYGLPISVAVGTDLVFATLTKSISVLSYARQQSVNWHVVCALATGSLPVSLLIVMFWPGWGVEAERIAQQLLGGMLILTACFLVLRPFIARPSQPARHHSRFRFVALGMLIGGVVTLTSVGAGVVGTVMLLLWLPHLPLPRIIGTEIAHAVVLTGVAGLGHMSLGHVDWSLAFALTVGSIPGALLGAHWAHQRWAIRLRPVLVGLISLSGLRLLAGV